MGSLMFPKVCFCYTVYSFAFTFISVTLSFHRIKFFKYLSILAEQIKADTPLSDFESNNKKTWFVNTRSDANLRHSRFNVLSLREVWESEGCVTVTQLAGWDPNLTHSFFLSAVMSVHLNYSRSTNPPHRSLVRSRWLCEVSPSVPQKTHKEAGPVGWSFRGESKWGNKG